MVDALDGAKPGSKSTSGRSSTLSMATRIRDSLSGNFVVKEAKEFLNGTDLKRVNMTAHQRRKVAPDGEVD